MTYQFWRPWCLRWGATAEEATKTLPGDDLLVEPDLASTRAISINAPTDAVWPWLAQMGSGRGGVYTYDWIENLLGLQMHSVDVVLPQFQEIKVGDAQRLGKNGPVLRVAVADAERAWSFARTMATGCGRFAYLVMARKPDSSAGTGLRRLMPHGLRGHSPGM